MAARAVDGMSLDRFMAKHTSEDNASFAEIMAESNKRRRLSKPWLSEQKDKVKPFMTTGHLPGTMMLVSPPFCMPRRIRNVYCVIKKCS